MANYKTKVKQNFINLLFDTYALTFKKMMTISKNYGTIGQKKEGKCSHQFKRNLL